MDKVLVLNADFTPLNVTSMVRGYVLVQKGKAEVLKTNEKPIFTGMSEVVRPLIIRLLNFVRFRLRPVKIKRERIYKRDGWKCVYCESKRNLTIDHVLPKCRGGKNTWSNLVTCCNSCNSKKNNKTPEEANMKLLVIPIEPSIFSDIINPFSEKIWIEFKNSMMM
jgi:CRISPR/Cas system Type II protein with McrA/HNH and RuvC-like nuclease domain